MKTELIVGNGGGSCRNLADVERLCQSAVTRILFGPITVKKREGNLEVTPGGVYWFDPETYTSINAIGLKNEGKEAYRETLRTAVAMAHAAGKELWVTIAGFSAAEFAELALFCAECRVDGIQINLSCPNIHDTGERKPIFSYIPELTEEVLMAVRVELGTNPKSMVGAKLSPVPDDLLLPLSNAIVRSEIAREVVAVNTLPDRRLYKPNGEDALNFRAKPDGPVIHTGGLAGKPILKEGVRVVRGLGRYLPFHIRRVGIGGIWTGTDVKQYLDEDAVGFECTTACLERTPRIFSDILEDYFRLLETA